MANGEGREATRSRTFVLILVALVVAVSPAAAEANRVLYASHLGSNDISALEIDASGALAPITDSPFAAGDGPLGIAISPDGSHLYVANSALLGGASDISAYTVAADGSLAEVAGSPFKSGEIPAGMAISPSGSHLYVTNQDSGDISAYAIAADGSLAELGSSPFAAGDAPLGIAISPEGRHLYVTNTAEFGGTADISAYAIAADGSLAELTGSPFAAPNLPIGVAIAPDGGHLYVTSNGEGVSAYSIASDGSLAELAGSPVAAGSGPRGVAVSPDGSHLYAVNSVSGDVSAYTIAADGSLAELTDSPFDAGALTYAVTVSPDGKNLYAANANLSDISAYTIAADGSLAELTDSPFGADGSSFSFQSLAIAPNQGPHASLIAPAAATAGSPIEFDGSASTDPDGNVASYAWDFGDGTKLAGGGSKASHAYAGPGTYTVTVTATDDEGCSTLAFTGQTAYCNGSMAAIASREVTVSGAQSPPGVTIEIKGKRLSLKRGTLIVKLACTTEVGAGPCDGKVVVKGAKKVRFGGKTRKLKLAEGRYSIEAGETGKVKAKLAGNDRKAKQLAGLLERSEKARKVKTVARASNQAGHSDIDKMNQTVRVSRDR